jgi:LmbE family N-acetylglucosaminyl deacetylase
MNKNENILVVCAHPDDETLGLGGTLALQALEGKKIFVLIFTDGQFGRDKSSKGIRQRQEQARKACSILGIERVEFLNYEDQKLDTVPLVELACQIESV